LLPHLDKGDILVDGGNANFRDTQRRSKELEALGINFIGSGVSGGEEGALTGPSIMPGGPKEAHEFVRPMIEAISSKVDGEEWTAYICQDSVRNYVKIDHYVI